MGGSPEQLRRQMQALQDNTRDATDKARRNPFVDGVRVDKVALTGTPGGASASIEIAHGLGRKPTGFFVINQRGGSMVPYPKRVELSTRRLVIATTASATVDLWVF